MWGEQCDPVVTLGEAPYTVIVSLHGGNRAVYHDILEFSARVLVTDGIEFLIGPTISNTSVESTSTRGRSLALTAHGRTLNG